MPINRHQFQSAAKQFRAGKISLNDFTDQILTEAGDSKETKPYPPGKEGAEAKSSARAVAPGPLPPREAESHKGDYGRILCIGGSLGMAGAIAMTGLAALRSGAGLVTVAAPQSILGEVAGLCPCVMTLPMADKNGRFSGEATDEILNNVDRYDVIAIGPGMGRSKSVNKFLTKLLNSIACPVVLDADALNAIADMGSPRRFPNPCVITPHPGEFARLTGRDFSNRLEIESAAAEFANLHAVTVLLKGSKTLITDGQKQIHNSTGNPGMATAGSGDVLTGVLAAMIGQGLPLLEAAVCAARIHGIAGDHAARKFGQTSMIATDIIDCLPAAFQNN